MLVQAFGLLALGLAAYGVGRYGLVSHAPAAPPVPLPPAAQSAAPVQPPSDYSQRPVAYIYGNIMISREELGEYLIAREGAERLESLVNKKIIEHACQAHGIVVTSAEIDRELQQEMDSLGVKQKDFEEKVLKQYRKTLYEWREDVIRPKIAMNKLCRDQVQVTDEDLRNAFEAHYGEKIKCRMIVFPKGEEKNVMTAYPKLRDSDEEFTRAAKQQAIPSLAARAGEAPEFGRHTTGSEVLEQAAFSLRPGEVSQIVGTPEGLVVLKCDQRIPAQNKRMEEVREHLIREIVERKVSQQVIPQTFARLREEAKPTLILKRNQTEEEWLQEIQQLDKEAARLQGAAAHQGRTPRN
jgi:hypothetical protein